MLLPIYKKGSFGKYSTSVGLSMYDFLAEVKRDEKRKMLSRDKTLQKEPLLKKEGLLGGGYYVEYLTVEDKEYLLKCIKFMFPAASVGMDDIESTWSGGDFNNPKHYPSFIASKAREITSLGISIEDATNIAAVYGTNTDIIVNLANEVIEETELPLPICLTLHYAVKHEMVLTPVDFFMRRTGTIFFDINWVDTWKLLVIEYMAQLMEWTVERKEELTEELEMRIAEAKAKA